MDAADGPGPGRYLRSPVQRAVALVVSARRMAAAISKETSNATNLPSLDPCA